MKLKKDALSNPRSSYDEMDPPNIGASTKAPWNRPELVLLMSAAETENLFTVNLDANGSSG